MGDFFVRRGVVRRGALGASSSLARVHALALVLASVCTACSGGRGNADPRDGGGDDGGLVVDGRVVSPDGGSFPGDGGAPRSDGGGPVACEPRAGSTVGDAYCDLVELAVFGDGMAREARLFGRSSPDGVGEDGCAVVDSVEVFEGGTSIGTLAGVGAFSPGTDRALLARGPALPAMVARCGGDADRFGGFGFVVRGRIDGGTFEARCADAEGGSRWPPALRVTCHDNVDDRPFSAYALVDDYGAFLFTTIAITVPHGPGGALTSVDGTARVIVGASAFGPPPPIESADLTGFMTSVLESSAVAIGPYTDVQLTSMSDSFGPELCPPPTMEPIPGEDLALPPVMLLRITGVGERGAFSTEAYLDICTRTPPRP